MRILDELSNMIMIGLVIFSILAVIIMAVLIIMKMNNKAGGIYEEGNDYSLLKRMDSEDYLKFDDIKDRMIICDGGYRFVAAVRGYGFDFYRSPAEVQAAVMQNFIGFINTITTPTMYRQHSKAIDVEHTMGLYEEAYRKKEMELFEIAEDIRNITLSRSERVYTDEEKTLFEDRLEELNRAKKAKEWQKDHLRDQMAKLRQSSGEHVDPERVQCWIFEWSYNPMDFTMDLTKEQIYEKAVRELEGMANAKIHALQNCRVRAVRCSTEDLIEMTRRYSSPVTANCFRMRDVLKSSFFDDFNFETDHEEMLERAKESIRRSSSLDTLETFAENRKSARMMPSGDLNRIGERQEKVSVPVQKLEETENEPFITDDILVENKKEDIDVPEEDGFIPAPEEDLNEPVIAAPDMDMSAGDVSVVEEIFQKNPEIFMGMEDVGDQEDSELEEALVVPDDVPPAEGPEEMPEPDPVVVMPAEDMKQIDTSADTVEKSSAEDKKIVFKSEEKDGAAAESRKRPEQKRSRSHTQRENKAEPAGRRRENTRVENRKRPSVTSGKEQKRAMMEQWLMENNIEESLRNSKQGGL